MNAYRTDRCSKHQDREILPPLCSICQRIKVEREIATRVVVAMLEAGYILNVDNGGDENELPNATADRDVVLGAMFATDSEILIGSNPCDGGHAWVQFVYGNDGWDVISDYDMSIDHILEPINDYADTLAN